jgi:hypothetical protein
MILLSINAQKRAPDRLPGVSYELSHGFHSAHATRTDLRELFSAPGF